MIHIFFCDFQEASRIRKEADDTKRRAVDLKDDADSLSDDVTDTEDQINNLNVQADGDSDLATEVTYTVELQWLEQARDHKK